MIARKKRTLEEIRNELNSIVSSIESLAYDIESLAEQLGGEIEPDDMDIQHDRTIWNARTQGDIFGPEMRDFWVPR